MQTDMHYYAILYLCLAAGLKPEDAVKIAYSSQYVDDAVYSAKVKVIFSDGSKKVFDPIRCAHNGLKSFGAGVQEKVYFPFHFLPGMQGESYEEKVITQSGPKNNLCFNDVVKEALTAKNLYRIGISLHVLADTYSHEGFSGLWSQFNHVEQVKFMPSKNSWFKSILSKLRWTYRRRLFNLAPAIGHGKAGHLPDIPYLGWSHRTFEGELRLISNNLKFCNCLWILYKNVISKIPGNRKPRINDDELRKVLWEGVMQNKTLRRRCNDWRSRIKELFENNNESPDPGVMRKYSDKKWIKEIGKIRKRFLFIKSRFKVKVLEKDFRESDIFKFHVEALKHRIYIMENTNAAFSKLTAATGLEDFRMSIQMISGSLSQTKKKELLI